MHPSIQSILKYFDDGAQPVWVALSFRELAHKVVAAYNGPETTAGLRKLLEARDCVLRAAGDSDSMITQVDIEAPR